MYENFTRHVSQKIRLDEEEWRLALGFFLYREIDKKEFLLREGEQSLFHAFVEKGVLRSYSIDDKGKEHISAFAPEGYWISDLRSYCSGSPSRFTIDAIEPAQLLLLTLPASEELCERIPKFERFFRILYQRSIGHLSYKIDDTHKLSARERYQHLLSTQPELISRVPQYYIASYLGITPESLSRIRSPEE